MDQNTINMILASGEADPASIMLKQQQRYVDSLRQQGSAPVGTDMVGRVAVPQWGQAISNVAKNYQAGKMQRGIDEQIPAMADRSTQARSRMLEILRMANRRPVPDIPNDQYPLAQDGMEDR